MRPLTGTLLAAQRKASSRPAVRLTAVNASGGVARLDWERLYNGAETDWYHALAVTGDGSLLRVRITPPADASRLYRQRVADPGSGSDFSAWINTGQSGVAAVAVASCASETSIVWIRTNREVRRIVSTDGGVTWGAPELVDYTLTTNIRGVAAAYRPDGVLAVFYADFQNVYLRKRVGGTWQPRTSWGKATGELNGIACSYNGDWELLVTGQDTDGSLRVWGLVYGDGVEAAAGTWSSLQVFAAAPAGEGFGYRQPFLDTADVCRSSWVEEYTGDETVQRPYLSHALPGSGFLDGLWREPAPVDVSTVYGLALAHDDEYAWASLPSGVWRARRTILELDISADVSLMRMETGPGGGSVDAALRNDDGRYAPGGLGGLAALVPGCRIKVAPGYRTSSGDEFSPGHGFRLESMEYVSGGGRAGLVLHGRDGWAALSEWKARQQFRWNQSGPESSVRDILAVVLARAGLALVTLSASDEMTGFFPDFTINPGTDGLSAVRRLLAYLPDVLFCEDETMYAVCPLPADVPVYEYGAGHRILRSGHLVAGPSANHVQVEGYDPGTGGRLLVERFSWPEAARFPDRGVHVADRNVGTVALAAELGESLLRKAALETVSGSLSVPVNCGQQLYDVVVVTDARAGLESAPRRVRGINLVWDPGRGDYTQLLKLGPV